jgi:hypothetical protein
LHPEAKYATRSSFVRGSEETGAEEGGPARGRWRAAVSFLDDDDDDGRSDRRLRWLNEAVGRGEAFVALPVLPRRADDSRAISGLLPLVEASELIEASVILQRY